MWHRKVQASGKIAGHVSCPTDDVHQDAFNTLDYMRLSLFVCIHNRCEGHHRVCIGKSIIDARRYKESFTMIRTGKAIVGPNV